MNVIGLSLSIDKGFVWVGGWVGVLGNMVMSNFI